MPNLEKDRDLFFEWLKKEYPMMHQWYLEGDDDWKTKVDYMFVTWLASASRDGYKLVPVEPSLETMQNMNREFINAEFDTPKRRMQLVYQAMLGAVDE